jgi:preprotein translocase subunit SecD
LASFGAQARAGVLETGIAAMVLVIIAFLLWYSRNEAAKGTLR